MCIKISTAMPAPPQCRHCRAERAVMKADGRLHDVPGSEVCGLEGLGAVAGCNGQDRTCEKYEVVP